MIRDFHMTRYLVVRYFFERVHNDARVKLLLKVAVLLLVNHEAVYRPSFSTAYNEVLLVDSSSDVLCRLSYHFADKSPRYCPGETQKGKTLRYGYWKVNIVQMWHETGSLAVLPTFFQ
jgi:hypothetical protein